MPSLSELGRRGEDPSEGAGKGEGPSEEAGNGEGAMELSDIGWKGDCKEAGWKGESTEEVGERGPLISELVGE